MQHLVSRVAGHYIQAQTSASELERKLDRLISDLRSSQDDGKAVRVLLTKFVDEFLEQFQVEVAATPRGGKAAKAAAQLLLWSLRNRVVPLKFPTMQVQPGGIASLEEDIARFLPVIPDLIKAYSGAQILPEFQGTQALYLNRRGLATKTFLQWVETLEKVFASVKGWRRKAVTSRPLVVALAGPEAFRGSAAGVYRTSEDILNVRATPKIMARGASTYGSVEYILVHELGHRYERFNPTVSVGSTTPYSRTEGMTGSEAFAEAFALGHFGMTSLGGSDFSLVLNRFEESMSKM